MTTPQHFVEVLEEPTATRVERKFNPTPPSSWLFGALRSRKWLNSVASVSTFFYLFRPVSSSEPQLEEKKGINADPLSILQELSELENNWDEAGALALPIHVISSAREFINMLSGLNIAVYHVAPGPWGEVLVDLRSGDKSVEILFYPDKTRFVKFSPMERASQGNYTAESLPQLISWLNE